VTHSPGFGLRASGFGLRKKTLLNLLERAGPVLPLQVGETALITVSALGSDASAEAAETDRQSAIKYMGKARK